MAEAVAFHMLPPATRLAVRADDLAAQVIGNAFGTPLSYKACRATTDGIRSALWLGPDEWLLIAPEGEGPSLSDALNAALDGLPASIVDVSGRNIGIAVSGPKAADAINACNPLDLALDAFPAGMCTRTVFAKAEIVLWRTGADAFHIEVWRSFAPYVLGQLREAALEYEVS